MKQLSIEEKARAYDEAIERAIDFMNGEVHYALEKGESIMCWVFPELKESEDERIRGNIIATIHLYYGEPLEDEAKEMIAWLEKQGEHAKFRNSIKVGDKVTRNRDGMLVNLSQLKRVAKPAENKGEHDMGISEATKQELEDNLNKALEKETPESWNKFLDEQKSADKVEPKFKAGDWIVVDNEVLHIKDVINDEYITEEGGHIPFRCEKDVRLWTIQDAQQWIDSIIKDYEERYDVDKDHRATIQAKINILKSLRPQSTWKPSDEQMDAIKDAIDYLGGNTKIVRKYLMSLYEQLKKLREK